MIIVILATTTYSNATAGEIFPYGKIWGLTPAQVEEQQSAEVRAETIKDGDDIIGIKYLTDFFGQAGYTDFAFEDEKLYAIMSRPFENRRNLDMTGADAWYQTMKAAVIEALGPARYQETLSVAPELTSQTRGLVITDNVTLVTLWTTYDTNTREMLCMLLAGDVTAAGNAADMDGVRQMLRQGQMRQTTKNYVLEDTRP